jgi:hypothetical protein
LPVPEKLARVALAEAWQPDPREFIRQQKIENVGCIALVGLLLADHRCANLSRVTDPDFMAIFRQDPLKPLGISGSFHPDPCRTWKGGIECLGLARFVFQPALSQLAGRWIQHGYLLKQSVKIATDDEHCSAPFSRALADDRTPSVPARLKPTPSSNQKTMDTTSGAMARGASAGLTVCTMPLDH